MNKKIIAIFAFTVLFQFAFSQAFDKIKLDSYFESLETNNKFRPGGVFTITDFELKITFRETPMHKGLSHIVNPFYRS